MTPHTGVFRFSPVNHQLSSTRYYDKYKQIIKMTKKGGKSTLYKSTSTKMTKVATNDKIAKTFA